MKPIAADKRINIVLNERTFLIRSGAKVGKYRSKPNKTVVVCSGVCIAGSRLIGELFLNQSGKLA